MQTKQSNISTEELQSLLGTVKVLDCSASMGRQEGDNCKDNYHKSHISNALFLDLDHLKDASKAYPLMMPSEEQFIDTMVKLNIQLTDHVVCYDTGAMQLFGYRAAWMLQAMGHPNVSVLDGGWPKWTAEGRPVDAIFNYGDANNGNFGYKLNKDKIKLLEQMKAFAKNEADRTYHLLDVRTPEQFDAGHIEGAQNFPTSLVLNADKTMKPADVRRAAFE